MKYFLQFCRKYVDMEPIRSFDELTTHLRSLNRRRRIAVVCANDAHAEMAGLLQGSICPVVLPSRSDSGLSKYYSIAMACITCTKTQFKNENISY